jgi:hypothetical protein
MRALSLTAPYPHLIAAESITPGFGKAHETRSWSTPFRGWLAIHAAKNLKPVDGRDGLVNLCRTEPFRSALLAYLTWANQSHWTYIGEALPLGHVVAVAKLTECYQILQDGLWAHSTTRPLPRGNDLHFGDYTPGRFAWHLTQIRALPEPVPCRGAQGLWAVPADVEAAVWAQVGQVAA